MPGPDDGGRAVRYREDRRPAAPTSSHADRQKVCVLLCRVAAYFGPFPEPRSANPVPALVPRVTITAYALRREGGRAMVMLRCPCQQGSDVWGEFWWTGGGHRWVFFDDDERSETYAEE